jgi:bifunctional DNA-binding transcriptional regulator/antitoxin component of YhaV-PrlF toxin-antitoxin module
MTSKVVKSTERGQITLPQQWRKNFDTDNYVLEMHKDKLVITPFKLEDAVQEDIIFDAHRDNDGKGIPAEDMLALLKKIANG